MIRYVGIDAKYDVIPDSDSFAWFNTVTDYFLVYNDTQVWTTWSEFEDDWRHSPDQSYELERFRSLYPKER